jgi:hypothetical protein
VGEWLIEKADAYDRFIETEEWTELDLEATDDH